MERGGGRERENGMERDGGREEKNEMERGGGGVENWMERTGERATERE